MFLKIKLIVVQFYIQKEKMTNVMEEVINKCIDERIKRVLDDNVSYVGIIKKYIKKIFG